MAYGDAINDVAAADTGYYTTSRIRVSNPIECGDANGQGGTYFPPGDTALPGQTGLQIQYKIGDTTAIINGITVPAIMAEGDTALVLNYKLALYSVNVSKDQVPLPYGSDSGQYEYTVSYGPTSATITFSVAVGTGELYNITALTK